MSERRFALVDFTYKGKAGRLRLHEAGHTYALQRAIAHAATKRELVAKQRPPHWTPPSIFRQPEVLPNRREPLHDDFCQPPKHFIFTH